MHKIKAVLFAALGACFIAMIAYSCWQMLKIQDSYNQAAQVRRAVLEYRPDAAQPAQNENPGLLALQAKYPDTAGWLAIPGTDVDYPFVWRGDNDYYLRRNLDGAYAAAGTIFIDGRCRRDFSSRNTILYGHHMKNGSMFGTLKRFADKDFFEANAIGTIYLPGGTLKLEIFAYLAIDPSIATEIYSINPSEAYLEYVRQNALHFRDIALDENDRVVTLSTCTYEFENARAVLLAKIA